MIIQLYLYFKKIFLLPYAVTMPLRLLPELRENSQTNLFRAPKMVTGGGAAIECISRRWLNIYLEKMEEGVLYICVYVCVCLSFKLLLSFCIPLPWEPLITRYFAVSKLHWIMGEIICTLPKFDRIGQQNELEIASFFKGILILFQRSINIHRIKNKKSALINKSALKYNINTTYMSYSNCISYLTLHFKNVFILTLYIYIYM